MRAVGLNIKGPSLCIQDGPRKNTSAAALRHGSQPHCQRKTLPKLRPTERRVLSLPLNAR